MTNDKTCYTCDHWKRDSVDILIYSCELGEVRPWFACAKWHRIRTEEERKDNETIKRIMREHDDLFKRLAKL